MGTQKIHSRDFSFEFYPPKTEAGREKLRVTWQRLATLKPRFFSVTFGAGGSTRDRTLETVLEIQTESDIEAAPHISCIDSTRSNIREMLQAYRAAQIRHLVALRGDVPSGTVEVGEFHYASELVAFIRQETGRYFHIEVAAYPEFHPQSQNAGADLRNFKRKVEAGADSAITQYFYNLDAYLRFVDSCEKLGIELPIVPGIMPITNYVQLARFSATCGAEIPRWLAKRLEEFRDDLASLRAFGIDVVTALCARLLEMGAPGLHFYTLNKAEATLAIWANLGLHQGQEDTP
ncbi:MAG: methylenetetrahydrofolate reductase [NAD(P)H] [Gammaproteobacteria bacterium]|jgi:methylenetetrahydrofolate reductase (NADPH)